METIDWIDPKEQLPQEYKKVLILILNERKYHVEIDFISPPKDGNLWNITDKNIIVGWMPLPTVPEFNSL